MNQSFQTVEYVVAYRSNKQDPQATRTFKTAEAAYHFALNIETAGGITIVTTVTRDIPARPILKFDTEN